MLSTVRAAVAPGDPHPRAADHASWCLAVAERADRSLRGPEEADGVGTIDGIAGELRSAHRWARDHDPHLAARLTAAIQLYAHAGLWAEPVDWARAMLPQMPADDPGRAAVLAAIAAGSANQGRLDDALRLGQQALESATDDRVRIMALDALSDTCLFLGRLDDTAEHAGRVVALGLRTGDAHAVTVGRVNEVLLSVYRTDRPGMEQALERLDDPAEVTPAERSPSDRAWRAYALGEALGDAAVGTDPNAAVGHLEQAIELGDAVANRYVATVARTSLVSLRARHGDGRDALADFASVLEDCRRHGNASHAATVLRNLVELLCRLEDVHHAVVVLGALSGPDVKASFGEEARRLESSMAQVRERVGAATFDRWWAEAADAGVDGALAVATDVVEAHLTRS
jgi:tetratricopeptide (TPR) repeat protein